tara:strand:+ start:615 stop:1172 length:558 start_codon:yes stop_codon:yes gene_type:complete
MASQSELKKLTTAHSKELRGLNMRLQNVSTSKKYLDSRVTFQKREIDDCKSQLSKLNNELRQLRRKVKTEVSNTTVERNVNRETAGQPDVNIDSRGNKLPYPAQGYYYYTVRSISQISAPIRSGPAITSTVIKNAPPGSLIYVLQRDPKYLFGTGAASRYWKVYFNGIEGYISKSLLDISTVTRF